MRTSVSRAGRAAFRPTGPPHDRAVPSTLSMLRSAHRASRAGDWTGCAAVRAHLPRTQQPHRLAAVRLLFKRELAGWLVGGAGGNRTRVLRRRTRASPGAVSAVV